MLKTVKKSSIPLILLNPFPYCQPPIFIENLTSPSFLLIFEELNPSLNKGELLTVPVCLFNLHPNAHYAVR